MGRLRKVIGSVTALLAFGALHAANANALVLDAADGTEDRPIVIRAYGSAPAAGSVFVYVSDKSGRCEPTAQAHELTAGLPLISDAVGPGAFESVAEYQAKGPGDKHICAYLAEAKSFAPIETAESSIFVDSGRAYTPVLRSPGNGALSYERPPTLTWDKGSGKDVLRIYRGSRPNKRSVMSRLDVPRAGGTGFSLVSANGRWRARFDRTVSYGVYSWTVTRRDPRIGTERVSPARRFRVGPSPLKKLVVKLRTRKFNSIKRPGVSKITIRSAPEAKVKVRLTHAGRTVARESYREGRFNTKSRMSVSWRCSATGSFKLKVSARDRYGNRRKSSVRWNVSASRCAEMKRKAEERRKAREEKKSGGGGGGSCTPGYSPCLPPASDYDCAGGSGDGPKYVSGPVYVTGDDPYDLDSDGDGVGCE